MQTRLVIFLVTVFVGVARLVDGHSIPEECGVINCDVTYQYCDRTLLDTRPVCLLCEDICGPGRIANDGDLHYCKQTCPVYLDEQKKDTTTVNIDEQKKDTTTVYMNEQKKDTTTDASHQSVLPWSIWVIVAVFATLVGVFVLIVLTTLIVRWMRHLNSQQDEDRKSLVSHDSGSDTDNSSQNLVSNNTGFGVEETAGPASSTLDPSSASHGQLDTEELVNRLDINIRPNVSTDTNTTGSNETFPKTSSIV